MNLAEETFGLSSSVLEQLRTRLARHPKVERAMIFGSRAQGTARPGSDIDIAIVAPDLSSREFARLWTELDELPIAFKMDIVHFDRLTDEHLKAQIVRHGKTIYSRTEAQ